MKIQANQLDALLRQDQLTKTSSQPRESFDSLLNQEISQGTNDITQMLPPPGAGTIDPLMLSSLEETSSADSVDNELVAALMGQADGALSTLDAYAKTLNSTKVPARNSWELLGSLDTQIAAMRGNLGKMSTTASQGLDSMVNELEVIAATEKFKFNRGDYI